MKRLCLRALVIVIGTTALLSLVGLGFTTAELEGIVSSEAISEISAAAGLALADSYAETKTVEELEELAVGGRTIGIRTAASAALAIAYQEKTGEELLAILKGEADPVIRAAAIEPALEYLVGKTADELKELAEFALTSEMKLAAAKAYYILTSKNSTQANMEEDAAGDDALAVAAGEILGGFYLFFPPVKTQAQLEEIALNGATEGLRIAGRNALIDWLVSSELTAEDLEVTLAAITGTLSVEYRDAYIYALASRYGS